MRAGRAGGDVRTTGSILRAVSVLSTVGWCVAVVAVDIPRTCGVGGRKQGEAAVERVCGKVREWNLLGIRIRRTIQASGIEQRGEDGIVICNDVPYGVHAKRLGFDGCRVGRQEHHCGGDNCNDIPSRIGAHRR